MNRRNRTRRIYRPNSIARLVQLNNAVRQSRDQEGNSIYLPENINNRLLNEMFLTDQNYLSRNIVPNIQRAQGDALTYYQQQLINNIPTNLQQDYHPNRDHMDRYLYRQAMENYAKTRAISDNQKREIDRRNRESLLFNEMQPIPPRLMRNYGVPILPRPPHGYTLSPEDELEIALKVPLPISNSSSTYSSSRPSSVKRYPSNRSSRSSNRSSRSARSSRSSNLEIIK